MIKGKGKRENISRTYSEILISVNDIAENVIREGEQRSTAMLEPILFCKCDLKKIYFRVAKLVSFLLFKLPLCHTQLFLSINF